MVQLCWCTQRAETHGRIRQGPPYMILTDINKKTCLDSSSKSFISHVSFQWHTLTFAGLHPGTVQQIKHSLVAWHPTPLEATVTSPRSKFTGNIQKAPPRCRLCLPLLFPARIIQLLQQCGCGIGRGVVVQIGVGSGPGREFWRWRKEEGGKGGFPLDPGKFQKSTLFQLFPGKSWNFQILIIFPLWILENSKNQLFFQLFFNFFSTFSR